MDYGIGENTRMEKITLRGIIPPILTPMNQDEEIDLGLLDEEINSFIHYGAAGIFCLGTNGEFFSLTEIEKESVIRRTVTFVDGRIPVLAGTGGISTKATIELSLIAEGAGADILSIISPYFAVASQEELFRHYEKIARVVHCPILIYNIPGRTGINVSPQIVSRLSEIDNIVGIKDSSGNFDNMIQYLDIKKRRPDFKVYSGNDSLIYWNLVAGGDGAISGVSNVFPQTIMGIFTSFETGQHDRALQYQNSIRVFRDLFQYGNPNTIVKLAANIVGRKMGPCRSPFNYVPSDIHTKIEDVVVKCMKNGLT